LYVWYQGKDRLCISQLSLKAVSNFPVNEFLQSLASDFLLLSQGGVWAKGFTVSVWVFFFLIGVLWFSISFFLGGGVGRLCWMGGGWVEVVCFNYFTLDLFRELSWNASPFPTFDAAPPSVCHPLEAITPPLGRRSGSTWATHSFLRLLFNF